MLQLLRQVILEVLGWKGDTFQRDLIGKGLHGTNVHFTPEKSALLLGFLCIFLDGSGVKNPPANAGDAGLILEFNNDLFDCNACQADHSSIPISFIQQIFIEHYI